MQNSFFKNPQTGKQYKKEELRQLLIQKETELKRVANIGFDQELLEEFSKKTLFNSSIYKNQIKLALEIHKKESSIFTNDLLRLLQSVKHQVKKVNLPNFV